MKTNIIKRIRDLGREKMGKKKGQKKTFYQWNVVIERCTVEERNWFEDEDSRALKSEIVFFFFFREEALKISRFCEH